MLDRSLRDCFSPPIPEIFESARLLDRAARAHIEGNSRSAVELIREADMQAIGDWLDPLWLRRSDAVNAIKVDGLPPIVPKVLRYQPRIAPAEMRKALVQRDGHHCRFCGMPLIRVEVRRALHKYYPDAVPWDPANVRDQHRGLQAMWFQYDHVQVHSRKGQTTLENLVAACSACNFGRDKYTLEEMRLSDPRANVRLPKWDGRRTWTGLETILPEPKRYVQDPDSLFKPA
jgi:5-methylcytosine-specific restriction endonuclease McrA